MKKRKKKTVKRTIAWGLAAVMCMGIVPSNMVSTYAQSSSVVAAQEEVAEVSSEIKESAFAGCSNLSIIDICYVKEIYDNAFYNCTSLEDVQMTHIEKFGKQAFMDVKIFPKFL